MAELVRAEIANSRRMEKLCEEDCRLGYPSEAEGYHFFPVKLQERVKLLEELLAEDFPAFDVNAPGICEYTGKTITGKTAFPGEVIQMQENTAWSYRKEGSKLCFEISGVRGKGCTAFLEINRLHPPLKVVFASDDNYTCGGACFNNAPDFKVTLTDSGFSFVIDLDDFKDFLVPGAPLRFNIYGENFAWVPHHAWPARLSYGNTNPNCAGTLV